MNRAARTSLVAALALAAGGAALAAQPLSTRTSFRVGGSGKGTLLCLAQTMATHASLKDMFDRGYEILCRDAAIPIGVVHALRSGGADAPAARLAALRSGKVDCAAPASADLEDIGAVRMVDCKLKDSPAVGYRIYQLERGRTLYSAEGLTGYHSALRIALRSVVADRPASGEVEVALTGASDPAAFARVQAGTLDRSRALAEAYRRNNAGNYAESAEFFAAVTRGELGKSAQTEALVNEALQKSNLGHFAEADDLLERARLLLGNDVLVARQLRNYRAMHLLNQGLAEEALAELAKPLPAAAELPEPAIRRLQIDRSTAARLNADAAAVAQLGGGSGALQIEEKAQILDAQVRLLEGSALRLTGRLDEAQRALAIADRKLQLVRGGRLPSIVWMRAQILSDEGAIAAARGDRAGAERQFRAGLAMLEVEYPGTAVLQSARGRLADFLAASGADDAALALFRAIVRDHVGAANSPPSLARILVPYAELLLKRSDPASAAELFAASQIMLRPGVAQTQAVLARELSGGSDEAARLFRQSVTLTRQIERSRSELARLEAAPQPTAGQALRRQTLAASLDEYQRDQVATQAGLAAFPRFRAVSGDILPLAELQRLLKPGEAYYKLTVVDRLVFGLLVTPGGARAVKLAATANELDDIINRLRRTISTVSAGETVTFPFDVELAAKLYDQLFAPLRADLAAVDHLIFEPDGAMLRISPNLLVRDNGGIAAYASRVGKGADPFDLTGIGWLGRAMDISTSVSAPSFRDVRLAPRAAGQHLYLGLGDNAPATATFAADDCALPAAAWSKPIAAAELNLASRLLGAARPGATSVVTGAAFSDTALRDRRDLADYRIVHFATHGLLTSQRPRCAAQPALMTSFGGEGSDGLLTFREIFDLKLDADLIILSACDTAGAAGAEATQDAGLGGRGELALDGLVRAFVGAGGRLVIASHWPVPDDYDATGRLIGGLFSVPPGVATVSALRRSQLRLMDDPKTSHPYYWAAFAVVGDGRSALLQAEPARVASR
ncbi:CHAT domain-containing protein [Sphingomonas mesophila]|uniref:CHAT domain-containing protein n=1 Tax=Sphingomonas mesophila TaxID=2303576 RepID=UPI000E57B077|nr:CHAT domain-containing protein [Sphingomonas mesophila]